MSELSIFIDESGDFGSNSEYYLVTFVFHDQRVDISPQLSRLSSELDRLGFPPNCAIHTGPVIRREEMYVNYDLVMRRRVFDKLHTFMRTCDIRYKTFVVRKKEYLGEGALKLKGRLSREIALFLKENTEFFASFDTIIAYYDNGQSMVTNMVNTLFSAYFFDVDFRRVKPSDYRLFQTADLLCTFELLAIKVRKNTLSRSERLFFESRRKLMKNYLKALEGKRF